MKGLLKADPIKKPQPYIDCTRNLQVSNYMLIRIAHWKNLQLFFECVCLDFFGLKLSIRCVCFTFLFLFFNISLPLLSVYLYLFDEILISFLVYLDILHIFHLKRALEMVNLLDAQLKEMNPNLDSIAYYCMSFLICRLNYIFPVVYNITIYI